MEYARIGHNRAPLRTTTVQVRKRAKKIARDAWHRARPVTTTASDCDQPPVEVVAGAAAVEDAGGIIAVELAGGVIAVEAGGAIAGAVLAVAGVAVVAGTAAPFSF
jgi:hypothetical protein